MFVNRMFNHARRYRSEVLYPALFGIIFSLFLVLIYPGEEGVKEMFSVILGTPGIGAIFPDIGIESAGLLLWIAFLLGFIVYFLLAVSGINIGAKVIPTVEEDSVEVFLGFHSISARRFYVENYIAALFSLILVLVPVYLIVGVFTITTNSTEVLVDIGLLMVISLSLGIFFLSLSAMATVLGFSKRIGKIAGFVYLFYAFVLEIAADNPEYADFGDFSINYYVRPSLVIFGDYDWEPFFVVLTISLVFFAVGLWRVKYPDFIEKVSLFSGIPNPLTVISGRVSISRLSNRFPIFTHGLRLAKRLTIFTYRLRLAKRLPIFTDQLRLDRRAILLVILFVAFQQGVLFLTLPDPSDLVAALDASNNPALSAFAQNHELQESLLGFVVLKFYVILWGVYGIALAFMALGIVTRDVRSSTHDLVFANDISPTRIVFSRIMSMVFSFTVIVWGTFFILRGLQAGKLDLDFGLQAGLFLVMWVHYLGLGIFLVGITMIPLPGNGRKLGWAVFIFFVMMSFIPFLDEGIEFLKYVSYLSYFDPVGIIYEVTEFMPSILTSSVMLVGSSVFTWLMTTRRYWFADLR